MYWKLRPLACFFLTSADLHVSMTYSALGSTTHPSALHKVDPTRLWATQGIYWQKFSSHTLNHFSFSTTLGSSRKAISCRVSRSSNAIFIKLIQVQMLRLPLLHGKGPKRSLRDRCWNKWACKRIRLKHLSFLRQKLFGHPKFPSLKLGRRAQLWLQAGLELVSQTLPNHPGSFGAGFVPACKGCPCLHRACVCSLPSPLA